MRGDAKVPRRTTSKKGSAFECPTCKTSVVLTRRRVRGGFSPWKGECCDYMVEETLDGNYTIFGLLKLTSKRLRIPRSHQ